jgi:hypothetical protein
MHPDHDSWNVLLFGGDLFSFATFSLTIVPNSLSAHFFGANDWSNDSALNFLLQMALM